jgi:hypothetical protein
MRRLITTALHHLYGFGRAQEIVSKVLAEGGWRARAVMAVEAEKRAAYPQLRSHNERD